MKRIFLIIPALALLAACGGAGRDGAGKDGVHTVSTSSDTTANGGDSANTVTTTPTYTYVEPNEDIAKIIFDSLANYDFDSDIWSAVIEADDDGVLDECFDTTSKTYRHFTQNKWSRYDSYYYNANIDLKCYQTNKSEWLGVVTKSINTSEEDDHTEVTGFYPVLYSNGKLTRLDSSKVFPAEMLQILKLIGKAHSVNWRFENTYLETYSQDYWPVKFLFDGEKFVTDTTMPLLFNTINNHGTFTWIDNNDNQHCIQVNSKPDSADNIKSDGIFKADGKVLLKAEITDGKVMAYTILDPRCGVAQNTTRDSVVGKPVAIGYPIANLIVRQRDKSIMRDSTEKAYMKDGKFVVWQHVKHDTYNNLDIYYEYISKDANSNIDSIRVYCTTYTASLEDDIKNNQEMTPEFKEAFNAFKFTERYPKCGTYKYSNGDKNHLLLKFSDESYVFVGYKLNVGGFLILVAKTVTYSTVDPEKIRTWLYMNDDFKEYQYTLPKPPAEFSDMDFEMEVDGEGLHYSNYEEKEFISFPWDGKHFVNQYE